MTGTVGLVRAAVAARDGWQCVAPRIDPAAGPCGTKWEPGGHVGPQDLEMDYVRLRSVAGRHQSPRDHVMLCGWHHQGSRAGRVWATSHREAERAYLETFR